MQRLINKLQNLTNSQKKTQKRKKSHTLYGVSGLLTAALLLGGGLGLPGDMAETAQYRQWQAESAYAEKTAEDDISYLVVDGRGYAKFTGYSPFTQAMYVHALNSYVQALPSDTKFYSVLAPTSAAVTLDEKYADQFPDQAKIIDGVAAALDDSVTSINILPTLLAHKNEYLYFRTDHHWTARAGYLAYTEICKAMGLSPEPISSYPLVDTGVAFLGSVAAKTGSAQLDMGLDQLYYYRINRPITYKYWNNQGESFKSEGVYKEWYLRDDQTNKYAFFMGGDLPYIKLWTGAKTGRKLAVIKDSYANTVIPFLTKHFDEIYVLDPRHSNFNAVDIIKENDIDEVLFLNYTRVVCLPKFSLELQDLLTREGVKPKN